jgi:hypothetical protein
MAMDEHSAKALALAPEVSWVAALALWIQAMWIVAEPERRRHCIDQGLKSARAAGVPEIEQMFAVATTMALTGDPEQDAGSQGLQWIEHLLPNVGDMMPAAAFNILGAAAALGHPRASLQLLSQISCRGPLPRIVHETIACLIARNEGRIDDASAHLQTAADTAREHAVPLGETSCLIGFSALAAATGDYERASRDLASARGTSLSAFSLMTFDPLVYRVSARTVRAALDPKTAARCRADGAAIPVSQALDAELARSTRSARTSEPST